MLDRVRDFVVPDVRFIDMLSNRLGTGQDGLVIELLLGTRGRRSVEAPPIVHSGLLLPSRRSLGFFEMPFSKP